VTNRHHILLVEDDLDSLAALFFTLTQAGYSVLTAEDGAQAVDLLSRGIHPRLIVLDLILPKVDGWAVLKHLQQDRQLREIPVIVTTGGDPDVPPVKGADRVLGKPIDSAVLLGEIGRLLGRAAPS
jgi:CheY-like chemotaxis protein